MPNDESKPPVVKALHHLLGQDGLEEEKQPVRVFSYHEAEDFNRLWSFANLGEEKPFLIFWKGFPAQAADEGATPADGSQPDRVAVNSYVTPYHWALAFAQFCQLKPVLGGRLVPRVWVLHAIPTANYKIWDRLGARCRSIRADLPWLRGVSLAGQASTAYQGAGDVYRNRFLEPIDEIKGLSNRKDLQSSPALLPESLIDALRNEFTGDAQDHHSIANLVGPVLLARCLDVDENKASGVQGSPQRAALITLLTQFDWIDGGKETKPFAKEVYCGDFDPLESLESVHYWLVDDQDSMGYAAILAKALEAKECKISASSIDGNVLPKGKSLQWSPEHSGGRAGAILAKLEMQFIADWVKPRLIDDVDVLFLDLRLWLSRPESCIKHPLAAVVEAARTLLGSTGEAGNGVAPNGDGYVLQALEEATWLVALSDVKYKKAKIAGKLYARELAAITLLPLLLSHYDPSLPIVIFSSTRQREVVKRLKHRPNIHLQFAKPGIGEQAAKGSTTRRDLVDAIRAALRQHQLRFVWKRIAKLEESKRPVYPLGLRVRLPIDKSTYTYKPAKWQLDLSQTRKRLAGLYMQLLEGQFNSLMSACYELMESAYSSEAQKRKLASIELVWPRHYRVEPTREAQKLFRFSLLAVALQKVRNLKAHGMTLHADPQHVEEGAHLACAGLLLALLDFIEQKEEPYVLTTDCPEPSKLVANNKDHFFADATDSGLDITNGDLRPWELAALNGKCATDSAFIAYALSSVLHTVRDRPGNGGSKGFGSSDLIKLCRGFANQGNSLGAAKKKPASGESDDEGVQSLPIVLAGYSEVNGSRTYAQFVVPFRYQLQKQSRRNRGTSAENKWEPQAKGIQAGVGALNGDAQPAFNSPNARFFSVTGVDASLTFKWIPDVSEKQGRCVTYRLCSPELILFAFGSQDVQSPQRIGLLILTVDFLHDADSLRLTLDDVLAFNQAMREAIRSSLSVGDKALWKLTTGEMLPKGLTPPEATAIRLLQLPLEELPDAPSVPGKQVFLAAEHLKPLSSHAYVHSVVTIEGENVGIVALYEDVRNECGELGEENLPPQGVPQECADLYRLLVVEEPRSIPKRNDPFTQDWLASRMYNRSAGAGICYAFDYNSACLVVGDRTASGEEYTERARTTYFIQWLHLLYMRAAISTFSERLSEITGDEGVPAHFDRLHRELQQFQNVNNFPFISDVGRSRDLYPKARTAMDLDGYLTELDKEVRLTTEYHNRQSAVKLSTGSLYFSGLAAGFAIVALLLGFLGINVLDDDTLCAMQRGLGDKGTSYCEKALKGKLQARLVSDLSDIESRTLERFSYELLCLAPGSTNQLFAGFEARAKLTQAATDECNLLGATWFGAWAELWEKSSRLVFWSGLSVLTTMLLLICFLGSMLVLSIARRFRRKAGLRKH